MDNAFHTCPARMNYSPLETFTNTKFVNQRIKDLNNFTEIEFRRYLKSNAINLMNQEFNFYRKNYSCFVNPVAIHNYPTRVDNQMFVQEKFAYDALNADPQRQAIYIPMKQFRDMRLNSDT